MQPPDQTAGNGAFAAALLAPDLPLPDGVVGPRGKKAVKRFAVYRNNVTMSLVTALGDIFPAVKVLLGPARFADLARLHIAADPPRSPLLFEYGAGFPAFLESFEPLGRFPYLADVARLERAWLDAFHAADTAPLDPARLAEIPAEKLGDVVFVPHPATRFLASNHAIVSIVSRCRADLPLDEIDPREAEAGLVTRPRDGVELRHVPLSAVSFFAAILAGETLGDAANLAGLADPGFDLAAAIAALVESGATTDLSIPD